MDRSFATLDILWCSEGAVTAGTVASQVQKWLLPSAGSLRLLAVAPLGATGQITRWLHPPSARASEKDEAEEVVRQRRAELEDAGLDIRLDVRWGDTASEIIKEAKSCSSDIVLLEANQRSIIQTLLAGDYQRDVLAMCPKSVLMARPEVNLGKSIVVLLGSYQNFSLALDKVRNLQLPPETAIYLASFTNPVKLSPGMLITFREYLRKRDEARNKAEMEMAMLFLRDQARRLENIGLKAEVIVREQDLLEGLTSLVDEVAAGLVIVPDTRLPSPDHESTRRATRIAQRLPCSVLVAR